MSKKLNKIIEDLFVEKNINQLKTTKKDITKNLGNGFFKKHIKNIFLRQNKIIIETKTIEAKTELNLIKKNFNIKTKLL